MTVDLDAIKALHGRTNQGTWIPSPRAGDAIVSDQGAPSYAYEIKDYGGVHIGESMNNATRDWVIAAHNDHLPALIAEVERLQSVVDEYRETIGAHHADFLRIKHLAQQRHNINTGAAQALYDGETVTVDQAMIERLRGVLTGLLGGEAVTVDQAMMLDDALEYPPPPPYNPDLSLIVGIEEGLR